MAENMNLDYSEDVKSCQVKDWLPGDLMWARVGGFPFWPCVIVIDPDNNEYVETKSKGRSLQRLYHVQFCGDNGSHCWVSANQMFEYEGRDKFLLLAKTEKRKKKYGTAFSRIKSSKWEQSVVEAERIALVSRSERLNYFHEHYHINTKIKSRAEKKKSTQKMIISGNPEKRGEASTEMTSSCFQEKFPVESATTPIKKQKVSNGPSSSSVMKEDPPKKMSSNNGNGSVIADEDSSTEISAKREKFPVESATTPIKKQEVSNGPSSSSVVKEDPPKKMSSNNGNGSVNADEDSSTEISAKQGKRVMKINRPEAIPNSKPEGESKKIKKRRKRQKKFVGKFEVFVDRCAHLFAMEDPVFQNDRPKLIRYMTAMWSDMSEDEKSRYCETYQEKYAALLGFSDPSMVDF